MLTDKQKLEFLSTEAIKSVLAERQKQDKKWGVQRHDPATWLCILVEELGEVSQANLQRDSQAYRKELVQLAAVALAWLESELSSDIDELIEVRPPKNHGSESYKAAIEHIHGILCGTPDDREYTDAERKIFDVAEDTLIYLD